MSHYSSDPGSGGSRRSTIIVFVVVLLLLGCIGAGATGAILLSGG